MFKEHFVFQLQHTFIDHLLCARMGLDRAGKVISDDKLLRELGKERPSTDGAGEAISCEGRWDRNL